MSEGYSSTWDHPVHETDVPRANPTAVRTGRHSPEHYVARDHDHDRGHDDEYETACGRRLAASGVVISSWKYTHYRDACRTCAAATGLLDLDVAEVLALARDELGHSCLVERREFDAADTDERPMIDVAPRDDPQGRFYGPKRLSDAVARTMEHVNYTLTRVEVDHRGAPLLVFSPVFRGKVTVVEAGRRP